MVVGLLVILTVLLIVVLFLVILNLFQFSKMDSKNEKLRGVLEESASQEKLHYMELEKGIVSSMRATTLDGLNALNTSLYTNNESMLIRINEFGNGLGNNMHENNQHLTNNINTFKYEFKTEITKDFEKLNSKIETKLEDINLKVEDRLAKGFDQTSKTFNSIIERLGRIDEAQKKIDSLSTNIMSLQDILTDKKSRGIFGEVQLYQILSSIFGDKNDSAYKRQYKLSNNTMVDAVVFAPEPIGNICIDSKFPLENYKRMFDKTSTEEQRALAKKDFVTNLKKHIDDISSKYILSGETSDQAIMFLPAESIFAEINAYHPEVIDFAQKKKIWITSPTTLMSVLSTVQAVMINIEREKYAHIIQNELARLGQEFDRYQKRWNALEKDMNKVYRDVKEISTTSNKISKRFGEISNVSLLEEEQIIEAKKQEEKEAEEIENIREEKEEDNLNILKSYSDMERKTEEIPNTVESSKKIIDFVNEEQNYFKKI